MAQAAVPGRPSQQNYPDSPRPPPTPTLRSPKLLSSSHCSHHCVTALRQPGCMTAPSYQADASLGVAVQVFCTRAGDHDPHSCAWALYSWWKALRPLTDFLGKKTSYLKTAGSAPAEEVVYMMREVFFPSKSLPIPLLPALLLVTSRKQSKIKNQSIRLLFHNCLPDKI